MEFVLKPIGGGKTTELLKWARGSTPSVNLTGWPVDKHAWTYRVLLFPTMRQARSALQLAQQLGYSDLVEAIPSKFWSASQCFGGQLQGIQNLEVGIDEVAGVLSVLIGARVGIVSATPDEMNQFTDQSR